jgi:hypothetical protein
MVKHNKKINSNNKKIDLVHLTACIQQHTNKWSGDATHALCQAPLSKIPSFSPICREAIGTRRTNEFNATTNPFSTNLSFPFPFCKKEKYIQTHYGLTMKRAF